MQTVVRIREKNRTEIGSAYWG